MTERVVAEWTESPFTGYKRRGHRIEHRVVVEHVEHVGTDVRHEIRSDDVGEVPDEWTPLEVYEGRPHGLEVVKADRSWLGV